MQPVRFFMVMMSWSEHLLSLPKRMGQADGLSKRLHRKRIHRFTCRVRAPRRGARVVVLRAVGYWLGWP